MERGQPWVILLQMWIGLDKKLSKCNWMLWLDSMLSKSWIYWEGTRRDFMLWRRRSLTVLGKAAFMSRKRVEVTLLAHQVSLILVVTKCMASVVQQPGLPPN